MEMGFTWTFPENEIKKQFFHLFFNFCKIMIVKILTIKIFHRPVEKQQNVIVNLFTMKFYCFSTSLWKNLFHRLAEKPFPPAYKYISSSLQAGKSISTQRWKRRNATWKKLKIDEKIVFSEQRKIISIYSELKSIWRRRPNYQYTIITLHTKTVIMQIF